MKQKGSAFRIGVFAALLLGLGLATSIAVAWWIALLPSPNDGHLKPARADGWAGGFEATRGEWRCDLYAETHDIWNQKTPFESSIMDRVSFPPWLIVHPPEGDTSHVRAYISGWPVLCLWADMRVDQSNGFIELADDRVQLLIGINLESTEHAAFPGMETRGVLPGRNPLDFNNGELLDARFLPMRLRWSGLIINTGVYALLWALLLSPVAGLSRLFEWRRQIKNRCVSCGYTLTDSATRCSECGHDRGENLPRIGPFLNRFAAIAFAGLVLALLCFVIVFRLEPPYGAAHVAAYNDNLTDLKRLAARGDSVDEPIAVGLAGTGMTPIHVAASQGHGEIVRWLMTEGVDLDRVDGHYRTILHHVISAGDVNLLRELLASGADVNSGQLYSPLAFACFDGRKEIIDILLDAGASVNPENTDTSPLFVCLRNDLNRARQFLDMGAQINFLDIAAATDDHTTEALNLLVEYGADLSLTSESMSSNPNVFADARTNLWFFVDQEHEALPVWIFLVEHNVELNVVDYRGLSLLMDTVDNDAVEFVRFLLEHGADPTYRIKFSNKSVLEFTDNEEIIAMLNEAAVRWNATHDP